MMSRRCVDECYWARFEVLDRISQSADAGALRITVILIQALSAVRRRCSCRVCIGFARHWNFVSASPVLSVAER